MRYSAISLHQALMKIPNILSCVRIVSAPVIVLIILTIPPPVSWWLAFLIFTLVATTDFLDGYLARIWSQRSILGRILDPTADKLFVTVCLLVLLEQGTVSGWSVWPAIIIPSREILISGLREFLARFRIKLPVTQLSKWKTTMQLVAIGSLFFGNATELSDVTTLGIVILWASSAITLYTGYGFLKTGLNELRAREESQIS